MIYVHIPFCTRKCFYCGFVSVNNKNLWEKYFNCLWKEIAKRKNDKLVTSIYFGGGTPSIVDFDYIKKTLQCIKSNYNVSNNAEITMEANPTVEFVNKIEFYKEIGINRISFGVQSLNEKYIQKLGRLQCKNDVLYCIKHTKQHINNVSADLLIGLENQTEKDIIEDIKILYNVGVKHFSVYMLMIEENTTLFKMVEQKQYFPLSDENSVKLYQSVFKYLKSLNFVRYEISNFGCEGYFSKHNLGYWQMKNYLGFGTAAHSFENNKRYFNSEDIVEYIDNNKISEEILTPEQITEETIMLGLRTCFGVKESLIKNKTQLNNLIKLGFVERKDENIVINDNHFNIANQIILKLI